MFFFVIRLFHKVRIRFRNSGKKLSNRRKIFCVLGFSLAALCLRLIYRDYYVVIVFALYHHNYANLFMMNSFFRYSSFYFHMLMTVFDFLNAVLIISFFLYYS